MINRAIYNMVVSVCTWKVAIVRTEYDYAVSFQSFQECPHQKLFFDLKDKNYKKVKMKGGLGWMKNIGNDPRSLFNGNHFSSIYIYSILHILTIVFHGTRTVEYQPIFHGVT